MREILLKYARNNPGMSFVEMERLFDENNFDWRGNLGMYADGGKKMLFWQGWNQRAVDLVESLMDSGELVLMRVHPLVYLIDGGGYSMPIVKRARRYRLPHWLPIAAFIT